MSTVTAGDADGEQFPVTDEERDAALAALVRATGVGQLSLEEFDRRTDLVLTTLVAHRIRRRHGWPGGDSSPGEPSDAGSSRSATGSCGGGSSWPSGPGPSW